MPPPPRWRPSGQNSDSTPPSAGESKLETFGRLYVGNLSRSTTSQTVLATFAVVGQVREVVLPVNRETGRPRGFAFVTMSSTSAAEDAISRLDGVMLDGRWLQVKKAYERRPSRSGRIARGRARHR